MENSPNNNENNSYQNNTNMNLNSFISNQNTASTSNSNQTITNKGNKKNVTNMIIIFVIIVIGISGYLLYLNKKTEANKEISFYSDGIKGTEIDTSLDLAGIFVNDSGLMSSNYSLESNTKAIIKNNKIYFSYSPAYCPSYYRDFKSSFLTYYLPKRKTNLCDRYDKNHNKSYDDLLYRNLMYANLDGTENKEINRFESESSIRFNYSDDNFLFYSSGVDNSVHKVDFLNNVSTPFKSSETKLISVANYPLSNKTNIVTVSQKFLDDHNFTLDYYDYKTLKKKKSISFNDIVNTIRLDKYNSTNLYTISHSFGKNYSNIYKNNEIIYTLDGIKSIDTIFTTKNYIYFFYTGQNRELIAKKIDKITYEEKEFKGNLDIGDYLEYISTGSDDNVYLSTYNGVYYFSEENDKFYEVIKCQNILSKGMVGNYLYVYVSGDDFIIYNTKTRKINKFSKVVYYYFDNNKLYLVHQDNTDVRLIYYKI